MEKPFDAQTLVPRHINKYLNRQKKAAIAATTPKPNAVRLDRPVSHWGTVGSETNYHLYPDGDAAALRKALSVMQSVPVDQIFLGNGSDEVLDLLVRTFCVSGKDHALGFAPSCARFEHFCGINGVQLHEVQLTSEFQLPIYKAKTSLTEQTKMLFISNPNPITGVALRNFDVVDLLDAFDGIVVIDESLVEYTTNGSFLEFLSQYPNVVIIQSFSHAWGMAGLRLGVAYAHPSVVKILNALKPFHNVNAVAQSVALSAIENAHQRTSIISETLQERERMRLALLQFKFISEVEDSQANFLMVKTVSPELLIKYLGDEQIAVCNVSNKAGCTGGVRITVGTAAQNDQLLRAMQEMAVKLSPMRRFLKTVSNGLKKASMFLGVFKKMFGGS